MKILIAYDGSKCADAAVEDLRRAGLPREGEVLVVSVADEGWPPTKKAKGTEFVHPWADSLHEAQRFADAAHARIQSFLPGWKVSSEALWGSATKAILGTVEWWKPDLLVVGSHGRSAAPRLVMGSVSLALVHHAPCAVRVVRERESARTGPIRIIVGNDGSPAAEAALRMVARRSWPEGTKVRVVSVLESVIPTPTMVPALEANTFATEPAAQIVLEADEREFARLQDVAENSAAKLEAAGLSAEPVVLNANARIELVEEAKRWNADMIFVGARGLGTLDRLLLGSVSTAVLTHAGCSVEVIRHGD
jgi:nucleotide-binding universal stress UspA family protein